MDEQRPKRRRQRPAQQGEMPSIEPAPRPEQPTGLDAQAAPADTAQRRRRRAQERPQAADNEQPAFEPVQRMITEQAWEEETKEEEPAKKTGLLGVLSAVDALVCRIGDVCLRGIKSLGVLLVLLLTVASNGIAKGIVYLKVKIAEMPHEAHLDRERTGEHVHRTNRKRAKYGYMAVSAVLVCIIGVSAYLIASTVWRSMSTKRLSQSLSQKRAELMQEKDNAPEETPQAKAPSATDEGEPLALDTMTQEELAALTQEQIALFMSELATPQPLPTATMGPAPTAAPDEAEAEKTPKPTATPKTEQIVSTTKYHHVGGDALPQMAALYEENRDLIGWLCMEEILDLPVVYRDNEYYLTHDFYKKNSASGTLFLDQSHPFKANTQNLLLHGHNMKDGTMFGRLVQYETSVSFLRNNPFIDFDTLWREEHYVIFAVLRVSLDVNSSDFFNYFTHSTFASDSEFERYIRQLQLRSTFSIPVDVQPSDALLTLSTCLDEDRLVIVARRLREGETRSELRQLVRLAEKQ